MGDPEKGGADIGLKLAGQEVNIRNVKSLNTIATMATLILVSALGVGGYFHEATAQAERAANHVERIKINADIAGALKESNNAVVQALRENNTNTLKAIESLTYEQRKAASAMREIACLSDPAIKNQTNARDFCKRMSRDDR